MSTFMLTTVDNPYSPYTQYDEWFAYDLQLGHYTCALLARMIVDSDELSQADQDLAYEEAVASIIGNDVTDTFTVAYDK